MFEKIKLVLWEFGIINVNVCPYCGNKLVPHYNNWYTCPDESCKFN